MRLGQIRDGIRVGFSLVSALTHDRYMPERDSGYTVVLHRRMVQSEGKEPGG